MVDLKDLRFAIQVLHFGPVDPVHDNLDVFVHFDDGSRLVATFFTLANIRWLFEKNQVTGECEGGQYFCATNLILVREYSDAAFEATVRDLLATGSFEWAFARCEAAEEPDYSTWIESARSGPPVRVVWGLHPS